MIFALANLLMRFFNIDEKAAAKYVSFALVCLVVLVFVIIGAVVLKSCNKPAKLDQTQIIKAQTAIEKDDRKQMIEILTESKVKEQGIDNSVKASEEATAQAKQDYSGKSNAELQAELEEKLK